MTLAVLRLQFWCTGATTHQPALTSLPPAQSHGRIFPTWGLMVKFATKIAFILPPQPLCSCPPLDFPSPPPAVFVHYQLDNSLARNPYLLWMLSNAPVYPSYDLLRAMREASVSHDQIRKFLRHYLWPRLDSLYYLTLLPPPSLPSLCPIIFLPSPSPPTHCSFSCHGFLRSRTAFMKAGPLSSPRQTATPSSSHCPVFCSFTRVRNLPAHLPRYEGCRIQVCRYLLHACTQC